jgi:hypothetical protein
MRGSSRWTLCTSTIGDSPLSMSSGLDASKITFGGSAPDASLTTPMIDPCANAAHGSIARSVTVRDATDNTRTRRSSSPRSDLDTHLALDAVQARRRDCRATRAWKGRNNIASPNRALIVGDTQTDSMSGWLDRDDRRVTVARSVARSRTGAGRHYANGPRPGDGRRQSRAARVD